MNLKDYEYYVQVFQDINNILYFQLTSSSGYLIGKLNPLRRLFKCDFFKNRIPIDNYEIKKIKKMYFIEQEGM